MKRFIVIFPKKYARLILLIPWHIAPYEMVPGRSMSA